MFASFLMLDSKLRKRSSKDDDDCENDSLGSCQKPVDDDSLTIGLAIGIPVFVILCILSFFLLRNYRKGKKESMEHDPDFDETGEATILPDFPNQKQYMEDPFHNRNSVTYPGQNAMAKESSTSLTQTVQADPYLDNFVLPYQHQTNSKVSLNEYAKQLGEHQAYGHTPRASTHTRTRNSSFSHTNASTGPEKSISPHKLKPDSSRQRETSPLRSMGHGTDREYTNLLNDSTTEFQEAQDGNDSTEGHSFDLESVENSESSVVDGAGGEKFAVNYENESELALNELINPNNSKTIPRSSNGDEFGSNSEDLDVYTANSEGSASFHDEEIDTEDASMDATIDGVSGENREVIDDNTTNENIDVINQDGPEIVEETVPREMVQSPFEDSDNRREVFSENEDERNIDTDFSQATTSPELDGLSSTANTTTTTVGNLEVPSGLPVRSKSPRISAFNLLKNDSDDENEGDDQDKFLTPEEEEELKRMKSVYKVYFDREKSQNSRSGDRSHEFKPDPNYPLGNLPHQIDYLRINKDLKTDTNYDKRLTTTSSIYSETPIFSSEEQQFYHNQQEFVNNPNTVYQAPPQQYQPPPQELPPLQQLPPPSDIRKSTIQTYTDYRPRIKNQVVPNMKQPFVPIENDQVWTSPITSPTMQSQASFGQSQQSLPSMNGSLSAAPTVPSATQLSRSSVVMLNPVTEITKQRKFRPAGSLPQGTASNSSLTNRSIQNQQSLNASNGINNSESDLIPGNRKSAVRRMMNTNF